MYEPGLHDTAASRRGGPLELPSGQQGAPSPKRWGHAVDPYRALRLLARYKWVLLAVILLGGGAGVAFAEFVVPRDYEAVSTLVYEGIPEQEGIPAPGPRDLRTLVDSVKVTKNLQAVKDERGLDEAIPELAQRIDVAFDERSSVIDVRATAQSPEDAAELSNTMVDVFMTGQRDVEEARLDEQLQIVEDDLRLANQDLAAARKRYDAFRSKHGIADLSTEQQHAIEAAAELRAEADLARAEAKAEEARLRQLKQATRRQARTVVSEQSSSPDQAALAQVRSDLAQARTHMSEDHPRVQSLQRRVDVLQQRVASGDNRVRHRTVNVNPAYEALQGSVTSSEASREAALEREESLKALVLAARERVDRLSAVEGQASALLAAVHVAEEHVADLEARRSLMADAARNPSSGFRVVSEAVPPELANPSKKRYAAAFGIPAILLLGAVGFLAWRELRGLKVLTAAEVSYWGGGPVIGSTRWPREPEQLDALVGELDDYVPEASGSTLVVGATEDEDRLASEIAERLNDDWYPSSLVDLDAYSIDVPPPPSEPRSGVALARRQDPGTLAPVTPGSAGALETRAWDGPPRGPLLRRAARLANRVLVVVRSGRLSAVDLSKIRARLGRENGIGFIVVDAPKELDELPDRSGDVADFWLR